MEGRGFRWEPDWLTLQLLSLTFLPIPLLPQAPSCLFTPSQQTPAISCSFPKMHPICSSPTVFPPGAPSPNCPHQAVPLWLRGHLGAR